MITEEELQWRLWTETPQFPNLNDHQRLVAQRFFERLSGQDFFKPLYRHQWEAIARVIHNGEVRGKWECLLDIVTGGGKTVIMAGLMSYFWQVRKCEKFLILVPNTIVRERVKDDFEFNNPANAFKEFPFFFNSCSRVPERLVCKVLRDGSDASGIRDAHVIVANIHQLYEGKGSPALEVLLADKVTPELVIFNDEAHNAAAGEYREVLKLLRRKTVARIDLTATPYRLDKQDLDTYPPLYEYHVQEAMRDGVVKQIVVTRPDIQSVKLQYEEWDENNQVIRTLDAEEMPWEQIESELRRSGAVRFVTADNARRQQLQIAKSCLDYQKKCVPRGVDDKPQWEPLMLTVALSQKDAFKIYETLQKKPFGYKPEELLLVHSKQEELQNRKAFLLGRKGPEGLNKEDEELWHETRKVRVIIAVSMLREGWDVRNIAIICLFRKFSFQKKGDRTYTVYGPQIIGRGLRRIRQPNERDFLFVIDHPAFNHDWLWEILSAHKYAKPLNPGDAVEDSCIEDIPLEKPKIEESEDGNKEEKKPELDIEDILNSLPSIEGKGVIPIADWQRHFREFPIAKKISSALQRITNIKSQKLGGDTTAHVLPEEEINIEELNESVAGQYKDKKREDLIRELQTDLLNEPHHALMLCFKMETAEETLKLMQALEWILTELFAIQGVSGLGESPEAQLRKLHFSLPQILDEFRKPEIVLGILGEGSEK